MRFSQAGFPALVVASALLDVAPQPGGAVEPSRPDWVAPMRAVHEKFTGRRGTLAHFGDSITVTLAYWTPLLYARKNPSPDMEQAFALVKGLLQPECWREWKGPEFGNEGGRTIAWAEANVAKWLAKLNPETALIMFGTNDVGTMEVDAYRQKYRTVVQKCLDNGTVVILSTIPPRNGLEEKTKVFAAAVRGLAAEMKVPLIDFQAEILRRRPDDWNGASDTFRRYQGYDVPTLLARDGVHPSNPAKHQDDYSDEGLRCSGYGLRSYLSLMKYAEVVRRVLQAAPRGAVPVSTPPFISPSRQGPSLAPLRLLPAAPPLPPPSGRSVRVGQVSELFRAAEQAQPGDTILVADGHYLMPRYFELRTDRVTLRGESGDPRRVVLDGSQSNHGELLGVSRCSGVTIADLTVQNVRHNGIKLNTDTGVQQATIRHCILHNVWQRAVKGVRVPEPQRERIRPRDCRIESCLFFNDRPKRFEDDPADTAENFGGNYIGGIDVMFAKGWTICDNVFVGIQGRTRSARGAVFLWHDSQDCLVERNVIIDCDSGICLGNSYRPEGVAIHCTRCVVRNNFVTRAPENGILADYTQDCRIVHNTVHDPASRLGRLIRIVHDADGLVVANNLLSGPKIRNESSGAIRLLANREGDWTQWLADPARGDLHLSRRADAVIGAASPLPDVDEDIDRQRRDSRPDVGADEFSRP